MGILSGKSWHIVNAQPIVADKFMAKIRTILMTTKVIQRLIFRGGFGDTSTWVKGRRETSRQGSLGIAPLPVKQTGCAGHWAKGQLAGLTH